LWHARRVLPLRTVALHLLHFSTPAFLNLACLLSTTCLPHARGVSVCAAREDVRRLPGFGGGNARLPLTLTNTAACLATASLFAPMLTGLRAAGQGDGPRRVNMQLDIA